jgi:hypothetical protein
LTSRAAILVLSLGFILVLTYLTVSVMVENGVDLLVVVSLIVLALLGFGVLGALTTPPDE